MSGSPCRCRLRHEEDISGQFGVTVPDAGELDQLRTRGGVYRRGLYTLGSRDNAPLRELSPYPHPPKSPPQNPWIQMMHNGIPKKSVEE